MKHIPIHKLKTSAGMEIRCTYEDDTAKQGKQLGIHRDDHYVFFLIEKGDGSLMVDFSEVSIFGPALYYILPGQVHHVLASYNVNGWFIAADTMLVPTHYREVFENQIAIQQPYALSEEQYQQLLVTTKLLHQHFNSDPEHPFYIQLLHSLLNSFIGLAAAGYCKVNEAVNTTTRPYQITQQFKKLLKQHFLKHKSPSWYAGQLMISESYLNEALKKTSGSSVSYWITNEVLLEARRLLYYSELNVKEIAHAVGYEDHTYFSRIFKQNAGKTPLAFRQDYRK